MTMSYKQACDDLNLADLNAKNAEFYTPVDSARVRGEDVSRMPEVPKDETGAHIDLLV